MGIRIAHGTKVKIAYRMTDDEDRLLEERTSANPYEYLQDEGQIVAPLERALEGKTVGFRTEITVGPREGYGEYDAALVVKVPRHHLPLGLELKVGIKFNTVSPLGTPMIVRVVEFDDQSVTLDGNHPLAGLTLHFDLEVLDVRNAEDFNPTRVDLSVKMRKTTSDKH